MQEAEDQAPAATPPAPPKPLIVPTVGRRLWFWPHHAEVAAMGMRRLNAEQPFDAGIVFVWGNAEINISVKDHLGQSHAMLNVPLVPEGESAPETKGYCTWMPFQQGQAKLQALPVVDAPPERPAPRYADADLAATRVAGSVMGLTEGGDDGK